MPTTTQDKVFSVNTHGNRKRLTIVATDTRNGYNSVMRFDTASASRHDDAYTILCFNDDGLRVDLDWALIAAMIAKAYKDGKLQPKHIKRTPAWSLMPNSYSLALFDMFHS